MKYIIIGLGNFGSAIAVNLTESGHEVMGVDIEIDRVEALKEKITHTMALDATDTSVVEELPLNETDIVVIAIGEDISANVMASAVFKQLEVKYLACRAISSIHQTILEAMNVDVVINPENEAATKWSIKLAMKGVQDVHYLTGPFYVIEITVPSKMVDQSLEELQLTDNYKVLVLTTFTPREVTNPLGAFKEDVIVNKIADPETILKEDEIMVIYGNIKDIRKMMSDF